MTKLYILRHAEAAAGADDRARKLTPKGRAQARDVGNYLLEYGGQPSLILHSPARRTTETAQILAGQLTETPKMIAVEKIYDAMPGDIIEIIKQYAQAQSLMIVGHNPTIYMLAALLPEEGDGLLRVMEGGFSPANLLILDVPKTFADLEPRSAKAEIFYVPKVDA